MHALHFFVSTATYLLLDISALGSMAESTHAAMLVAYPCTCAAKGGRGVGGMAAGTGGEGIDAGTYHISVLFTVAARWSMSSLVHVCTHGSLSPCSRG